MSLKNSKSVGNTKLKNRNMKAIIIPNGIMHLAESKAICPKCERQIPFKEIEEKFMRQDKHYIRMKCKCKRYIGITQDIMGDFRAYEL